MDKVCEGESCNLGELPDSLPRAGVKLISPTQAEPRLSGFAKTQDTGSPNIILELSLGWL